MKVISLLILFASLQSFGSVTQCPKLTGKFFCKGVQGSHEDMTMMIQQFRQGSELRYEYTYQELSKPAYTLKFLASDQGAANPEHDFIGKCAKGYYYNSKDGQLTEKTLLNYVNPLGNYEVIRNSDQSLFLRCDRVKRVESHK